jgi:endonuclease/exonuclease/phosphatase family metal-dependent hydrolase
MSFPVRFVVCTYNIWTNTRWPERRIPLQSFARKHRPDILCLQEVQSDSRAALDEVLSETHSRVDDPFEGWIREGNIYWNNALFKMLEYGAEQIGIHEHYRRLFWVRLRLKPFPETTLFVGTAHFTWQGHPHELETGLNVRIPIAGAAVEALKRLSPPEEPVLFMGDFNDFARPIKILQESGLTDCFKALGRVSRYTHPAIPTDNEHVPVTIDYLMHRGPIRPLSAEVVDFYENDLAPSDHKPVIATYAYPD